MKNKLKNRFYKSKNMNQLGRKIINIINYPFNSYYKICEDRKKYEVWDYKATSQDIKMYLLDTSPDGTLYGILHSLKTYSGIDNEINMYIEHGVYFGNLVRENSIDSIYDGTITFSNHRKEVINQRTDKSVIAIGPYIHYAIDYYNDEKLQSLKKRFGKTLLFFPPHSLKQQNSEYNIQSICKRLTEYKLEYKTVMVCLYYKDVNNGLAEIFEREGFTVVSAGHFYDYNFLSRLKSIIKLADHTTSMALGTHIGYCLYLGKSHEIINEDRSAKCAGEKNRVFNIIKENGVDERGKDYIKFFEADEDLILKYFYEKGNLISDKQLEVCNKYWGFDEIKQPQILRELLLGGEK